MSHDRPDEPALHSCSRQELLNILARELEVEYGAELQRQPLVYEQPIPGTDEIHVVVLWERWGAVTPRERGQLILEAYEQAQPALLARITAALGVTVGEARRLGMLPYRVVPAQESAGLATKELLRDAMVKEGALELPQGLMFCFPTRQLAQEAISRLSKHTPEACWAIVATKTRKGT